MNKRFSACAIAMASTLALAQATKSKKVETSKPGEVPSTMYAFRTQLLELQPYLISEEVFSDPKNEAVVLSHLKAFATFSKDLKKHERLKTPGFEITADQIQDHLNRTYEIYKGGNRSFAWWLFRSAVHGCNQCHTQVAFKQAPSLEFEEASISGTPFDQAEFWYTIRDYKRAMIFYSAALSRYGTDNITEAQARTCLKRLLSIPLRIDRSPKKAQEILSGALDHPQLSKETKAKIAEWIKALKALSSESYPDPAKAKVADLENYASEQIKQRKEVASIFVSGLLLEFVNRRSAEVTPKVLYWLAESLFATENDIFFATYDSYLKACVERFPSDPMARTCYQSLKDKWEFGFTGSMGTNLPPAYEAELKRLESKIKAK